MAVNVVRRCSGAILGLVLAAFAVAADARGQGARAPEIVGRAAWGAKPADTSLLKPQTPREIVIHHTAMPQQPKVALERKLQALQRFSRSPGTVNGGLKPAWGDVPYHFYIGATGRIGAGRDLRYAGDSNTGYSTADRIQIVLEGRFDAERPTPAQLRALDRLVVWLAATYQVPAAKISGHGDHVATDCPGPNLRSYLPALRDKVAKMLSGK